MIIFFLLIVLIWLIYDTWIIRGCTKLCCDSKFKLADFNSIFELSTAFFFAYHLIVTFRATSKERIYNSVDKLFLRAIDKIGLAILGAESLQVKMSIYKEDLETKLASERAERGNLNKHRIEQSFYYFAFYCLVAIICGALIEADPGSDAVNKLYIFLLVFNIVSILVTEWRYQKNKFPNFEWTVIFFVVSLIFSVWFCVFSYTLWLSYFSIFFFVSDSNVEIRQPFTNLIILSSIVTHFWPFFLFFRKMYLVAIMYTAVCYLIIFEVAILSALLIPFSFLGDILFKLGKIGKKFFSRVESMGDSMKNTSRKK